MKREIRKFFSRTSTVVFFYLLILSFCGLTVYLTTQVKQANDLSGYLGKYNSKAELQELYEKEQALLEENISEYKKWGLDIQPIYDRHAVFAYVLGHDMEASEGTVYSDTFLNESRDSLCVLLSMNNYLLPIMLVTAAFLSAAFFTADFSGKRHRFLYAGRNRLQILKRKFLTYFAFAVSIWIGLQVLAGLYNLIFSEHISKVLIVSGGAVRCLPMVSVWLVQIAGGFLQLLPFIIAFFFLGVLVRNETVAGILDIFFFLLIFGTAYVSEKAPFCLLGGNALDCYAYGDAPISQWWLAYAAELVFVLLLGIAALYRFRKADLG